MNRSMTIKETRSLRAALLNCSHPTYSIYVFGPSVWVPSVLKHCISLLLFLYSLLTVWWSRTRLCAIIIVLNWLGVLYNYVTIIRVTFFKDLPSWGMPLLVCKVSAIMPHAREILHDIRALQGPREKQWNCESIVLPLSMALKYYV